MKKTILIILPFIPYPLHSGGQIGVYEMINYLRNKFDISILAPWSNSVDELKTIWPNVTIYTTKKSLKEKITRKMWQAAFDAAMKFYGLIYNTNGLIFKRDNYFLDVNADTISTLKAILQTQKFDFVQVEFFENLPLISVLPAEINSIFIQHEIRYVRNERAVSAQKQDGSILDNYFLQLIKGQELQLLNMYKKVVTVSDVDRKALSQYLDPAKVRSSPLTIKSNAGLLDTYQFKNKILFLGGSDHSPNVNALQWFVDNCWGQVQTQKPDVSLVVIGAWDNASKAKLSKKTDSIQFQGFVNNLSDAFKDGILIVPMQIGSGMRMKIIDAVNYGIPIVTTTVGVEGIDLKNGDDCFIADQPDEFVSKLCLLIDSEAIQKTFIQNSRSVLDKIYSYDEIMNTRENIYQQ